MPTGYRLAVITENIHLLSQLSHFVMRAIMNLKALEYCVEIARQGSFTKAAQALHVAQPALSMAVSRLEDELGVALFNRATRQISVTAEGQLFLARAEACLEGLAGARRELQDLTQLHSGEIRVGVPPMYGIRHIPELLMQFRARYPGIAMHVVEGSADDISERLATRDIDVALLESRRVDPAWESVLLGSDEMVLCMAQDHPLAGNSSIAAQRLQHEPMLVFDNTFLQRHLLDAFCSNARVRFNIALAPVWRVAPGRSWTGLRRFCTGRCLRRPIQQAIQRHARRLDQQHADDLHRRHQCHGQAQGLSGKAHFRRAAGHHAQGQRQPRHAQPGTQRPGRQCAGDHRTGQ